MPTITDRVEAAAERGGSIVFAHPDAHVRVPWSDLHTDARSVAAAMQARGLKSGDHVALLGPTCRPLVTAMAATWLAGATLVVLPLPMRMASIEAFIDATRVRIRRADVDLLIVDPELAPFIDPQPTDPPMVTYDDLAVDDPAAFERPTIRPGDMSVLQFTSGSTSEPKGVTLLHETVCANLDAIATCAEFDPDDDVLISWLPLYHDMGLIGLFTLGITSGCDLILGAPQDFLGDPSRWTQWMSDYGCTATAGPNFSWVLATRALRRAEGLDLSRMRVALNGAEPVDPQTVRDFVAAGEPHGLRPGAIFPAFGMAELAIAGCFPRPLEGLRTDPIDLRVLETERYAAPAPADADGTRELVKLGRPVTGLEMRVVDRETSKVLADREVGELQIRGTSVTPGYYKNPEATRELFDGEWLRTGDLAYLLDGELVMCGRIKDVVIVGGRNIFPEDIERAVAEVEGVRKGNIIAFGVEGRKMKESVVVVAETKADDPALVHKQVRYAVTEACGVPPGDVVLVAPGSLPKTSSGKLQRSLCRQQYLDGDLSSLVTVAD
jgi:fatty-acyl-CoA synthase